MKRTRLCTVVLLAGAMLMGAACGDDSTSTSDGDRASFQSAVARNLVQEASKRQTFVGIVAGTNAYIALDVTPGQPVRAYVCDSAQIKQWFDGALSGQILHATGGTGRLSATRVGDGFSGTVDVAGRPLPFKAELAKYPAGLYLGAATPGSDVRGAWVVLPDGSQRGAATKGSVPVESTVSPENGTANAGGDTVDVGSGGGGVSPEPLKKKAKTKAQKCADLQRSHEGLLAARNQAEEGSADYKFLDAMARSALQNAVDLGCIEF